MKAKKIAIRGIIAVAAMVAICMFFSGTIRTIATAKVKIVQPKSGKLTQRVELTSTVRFPESREIKLEGAQDATIDIKTVKVEPGNKVDEGDTLFTAEVSDFDKTMQGYRDSYSEADKALQEVLDRDLRLKKTDEAWAQAYEALSSAKEDFLDADIALKARLRIEGVKLDNGELPEGVSDELTELYNSQLSAKTEYDAAQANMDKADRYSVSDDAKSYITDKIKYEMQLADIEEDMLSLTVLNESVKEVVAPEDCYITVMNVKAGEPFAGSGVAYAICPEDESPVLRADTTESTLTIAKNMEAYLTGTDGYEIESKVVSVGVTLTGGKYADIKLDNGIIKDMGGLYAMMQNDLTVTIEYKAKNSTTLLPSSAVRGSGNDRYVFTTQSQVSTFGTKKTVLVKTPVTVVAESNGTTSINEEISYERVAYMEDRGVNEGDAVMEYSE